MKNNVHLLNTSVGILFFFSFPFFPPFCTFPPIFHVPPCSCAAVGGPDGSKYVKFTNGEQMFKSHRDFLSCPHNQDPALHPKTMNELKKVFGKLKRPILLKFTKLKISSDNNMSPMSVNSSGIRKICPSPTDLPLQVVF